MIMSDQKRLKQVLFNLIGNAVKFTYRGEISVDVEFEEITHQLTFMVRDTGVGI